MFLNYEFHFWINLPETIQNLFEKTDLFVLAEDKNRNFTVPSIFTLNMFLCYVSKIKQPQRNVK